MSIRRKLSIIIVVLVGIGFFSLIQWIIGGLQKNYLQSMEESMVDISILLASTVGNASHGYVKPNVDGFKLIMDDAKRKRFTAKIYHLTKKEINLSVYITDNKGVVIYHSHLPKEIGRDYNDWNDVVLSLKGKYGARATLDNPNDPLSLQLYVAAPIIVSGEQLGVLTVVKPTMSVMAFILNAKDSIIVAGIISACSVVIILMLLTLWFTKPIEKLNHYVKAVSEGRRIALPELGKGEFKRLGLSFENMKDRLEGRKYMENYIHTLTHEMKSPISAIAGAAELLHEDMPEEKRKQFLKNISTESARLKDLVERLLRLSSIENIKYLDHTETIDLSQIAAELKTKFSEQIKQKELHFSIDISHTSLRGDRFLIQQAMDNLLQNALDFIHPSGNIQIASTKIKDLIQVVISDNGPGIPDFAKERVLERFYSLPRPDNGKKSTGLGLAIVNEIMKLHNGAVYLTANEPHGVKATLTFHVEDG